MTIKQLAVSAGLAVLLTVGASQQSAQGEPYPRPSLQLEYTSPLKTPALRNLEKGKNYVILIDAYDDVKKLSKLAGFSDNYGHIELVRDERAYGCRPPQCSEMSLADLEKRFPNRKFEVREVEIKGNPEKATQWFRRNLESQAYDLLYRNCTDAIVLMYTASGDKTKMIDPVDVDKIYATNEPLRRFMADLGMPKPNRREVFFPDQFTQVGKLVVKDRFIER
ncbi:hypothetical protein J4417_00120 [Candidatus Woesearchaeota archaeon]|nr:hypothetical protein [Candidatus Woesearchaeota archaeon]